MIKLSTYITEKYKINKNVIKHNFNLGDTIVRISFYHYANSGDVLFEIGGGSLKCYSFGRIENNRIYFRSNDIYDDFNDCYDFEKELFINDKGYYEAHGKQTDSGTSEAVYLNKRDALAFVNKFEKIYPLVGGGFLNKDKVIELLKEYFDSSTDLPKRFIMNDSLKVYYTKFINKLKEK